jgi:hypothetical protein
MPDSFLTTYKVEVGSPDHLICEREPNIFNGGLFERKLVKVIKLDVLYDQQPHP